MDFGDWAVFAIAGGLTFGGILALFFRIGERPHALGVGVSGGVAWVGASAVVQILPGTRPVILLACAVAAAAVVVYEFLRRRRTP